MENQKTPDTESATGLIEGKVRKGGINNNPNTPRPDWVPERLE